MKGEPWSLLFNAAENNQYGELKKLVGKLALPGYPKVLDYPLMPSACI